MKTTEQRENNLLQSRSFQVHDGQTESVRSSAFEPDEDLDLGVVASLARIYKSVGNGRKQTPIFEDASCVIKRGVFTGILGSRRSGKTTLLSILSGNTRVEHGVVERPRSISWPIGSRDVFRKEISLRTNIRFVSQLYAAYAPEMIDAVTELARINRDDLGKSLRELPDEVHSRSIAALAYAMNFECYIAEGQICGGTKQFRQYMYELFAERIEHHGFILTTTNVQAVRDVCDVCHVIINRGLQAFTKKGEAIRAFKMLSRTDSGADRDQDDDQQAEDLTLE